MLGLPGKLVIIIECVFFLATLILPKWHRSRIGQDSFFKAKFFHFSVVFQISPLSFKSRREGMLAGDRAPAPSVDSKTSSRVAEGVLHLRFRCLDKKLVKRVQFGRVLK